jgi:phage terminase small subunit
MTEIIKAPAHLSRASQAWFVSVAASYELESHHTEILRLAAECLDRAASAREVLAREGLVFTDHKGNVHPRPEAAIARDAASLFLRCTRELRLDDGGLPDAVGRLPRLPDTNGHKAGRSGPRGGFIRERP